MHNLKFASNILPATDQSHLSLEVISFQHSFQHVAQYTLFRIEHPLARLYSTSTLEHHHYDQCMMLLQSEGDAQCVFFYFFMFLSQENLYS